MDINMDLLKADFIGRIDELNVICDPSSKIYLYNLYGEAGIGKTSLLTAARKRIIEKEGTHARVFYIDLLPVSQKTESKEEETVRLIINQSEGIINGAWQNAEQVAGLIVNSLNQFSLNNRVVMMFDTTEALQEAMDFWNWLETYIVGPLVIEGRVHLVFAGRVPAPWRRFEVRRAVETHYLPPLQQDTHDLVIDILNKKGITQASVEKYNQIGNLVANLSKGHPLLSELLANEIANRWPDTPSEEDLCTGLIEPTINQRLFANVGSPWLDILWWLSPLDRFDATFIQFYLQKVAPELVEGKKDFFFTQGLSNLCLQQTVIWKEAEGERFHGVIGEIVRTCFAIIRPEDYKRANRAAVETFRFFANEFFKNEEGLFKHYNELADIYERRL
jgi:hypothetical protein